MWVDMQEGGLIYEQTWAGGQVYRRLAGHPGRCMHGVSQCKRTGETAVDGITEEGMYALSGEACSKEGFGHGGLSGEGLSTVRGHRIRTILYICLSYLQVPAKILASDWLKSG